MTRVLAIFFLVSVLVLAFGSGVNAQPLLTCDVFPCNLYETTNNDPAGPATETGPEIMLPIRRALIQ